MIHAFSCIRLQQAIFIALPIQMRVSECEATEGVG
jgi:hypothetical protein